MVKLKANPLNVNIIVTYAPTAAAENHDNDDFYSSLNKVFSSCKSQEITLVIGDQNAKVESEKEGKIVRPHGLG